jgi:putative protein kinase ArgK-like GTPase of G3E family
MQQSGEWVQKREQQGVNWFHRLVQQSFEERMREEDMRESVKVLEHKIKEGEISPSQAAKLIAEKIMR